jgi:hypothetical protein
LSEAKDSARPLDVASRAYQKELWNFEPVIKTSSVITNQMNESTLGLTMDQLIVPSQMAATLCIAIFN